MLCLCCWFPVVVGQNFVLLLSEEFCNITYFGSPKFSDGCRWTHEISRALILLQFLGLHYQHYRCWCAVKKLLTHLSAALRAAQTCRYLIYSEADFEVFRPAGATRCTCGWNLAWRSLQAKFHPHRCNDKGVGPPKLKFLLRFDRNVEYKHRAGAYPLRDFHKNLQSLYLISVCVRC